MKICTCLFFVIAILLGAGMNARGQQSDSVYLFSYFTGNGEDGLHLAYSHAGYKWQNLNEGASFLKPRVGESKLMRDPCIIKGHDGKFHMVWTAGWNENGIGYAYSEDLIHWSEQKFIPVMGHEPEAMNCWAPEIYYDKKQEKYLICWATTIPERFPETAGTGDNDYNHRMYYITSENLQEFSDTQLFYDPGFNVIDATITKAKGQYYMFLKDETRHPEEKNIRYATSDQLTGPYSKASAPITGDYWAEGPTVSKINGKWMVIFDKYTQDKMGAIISENLEDWEEVSDQMEFPEGTQHGTIFKVSRRTFKKLKNL